MKELEGIFENKFDCYADTWTDDETTSTMVEGDTVMAMTKETFVKVVGGIIKEKRFTIPEIRNSLSPITHLISMVEIGDDEHIKNALLPAKKSVNFLADRKVYDESGYDLKTVEYIKGIFELHSDSSTHCNGYRAILSLLEELKKDL